MRKIVAGIDEAGRGPLAGPVVAAAVAVIGKPRFKVRGDFDSKKLTLAYREDMYRILTTHPQIKWGIGRVSEKVIDKINIFQATKLAMTRALGNLQKRDVAPNLILLDGNALLDLTLSQKAIPKADSTIFECMAASIIAKVTRDRLMLKFHKKYPLYGFDRHKGYGTRLHLEMLQKHGPCPIHRLSFAPCKHIISMVE